MLGMFGIAPPKDEWTYADPVQVHMKDRWQTVNEMRCISHTNLRKEIREAFNEIGAHFRVTDRSNQQVLLQTVLSQDAPDAFYERPHAKMFAEYVIMQLCSSIGLKPAPVVLAGASITAAEAVLVSNTLRGGAHGGRGRQTLLTPDLVAAVLHNISLLRAGSTVESLKK